MNEIQAILVGFIQGLSEFLPISSSAHIVFASSLYKLIAGISLPAVAPSEEVFFDIVVHLATLFAVLIFFREEIKEILVGFFSGLKNKKYDDNNFKIGLYIIITTGITGVIGLLIKDFAHSLVSNPKIVSLLLVLTGFILLFSEKFKKENKEINLKSAIIIAIAQGLAVFPGLSRSGLTISSAIFQGIDRVKAAKFSFLMSIPVIILASLIYPLLELNIAEIQTFNFKAIILGFITAFVSGYICIKYFMNFLGKSSLKSFAYYCFGCGLVMFLIFSLCHHL